MLDEVEPFLGNYETRTSGTGVCPTGLEVAFDEQFCLERWDDWLRYEQRAVHVPSGRVLHQESGVIRRGGDGLWELSLVMNSGRIEEGRAAWRGGSLITDTKTFHRDRLGVVANQRRFRFDERGCDKELWLWAPPWTELRRHMWGRLERVSA